MPSPEVAPGENEDGAQQQAAGVEGRISNGNRDAARGNRRSVDHRGFHVE
jgi:hypothetical protein